MLLRCVVWVAVLACYKVAVVVVVVVRAVVVHSRGGCHGGRSLSLWVAALAWLLAGCRFRPVVVVVGARLCC